MKLLSYSTVVFSLHLLSVSFVAADEKQNVLATAESELNNQLKALEKAPELSPCLNAVRMAFKDARIRKLFLSKARNPCYQLTDVCCLDLPHVPEQEYVLFNFDCKPACFCLVDPQFLVIVDKIEKKVVAIKDPYMGPTKPCQSIREPVGRVTDATQTELFVRKRLNGELRVAAPVWIYGPFPKLLHVCKTDDVYVFQIRYPIRPGSLPVHLDAYSDSSAAIPTDAVLSNGEVAILTEKPQIGTGFGVGYVVVFVKAFHEGNSNVTVKLTTDDGSVERIPFSIQVDAQRRTLSNGHRAREDESGAGKRKQAHSFHPGYITLINETKDLESVTVAVVSSTITRYYALRKGHSKTIRNLPSKGYGIVAFDRKQKALDAKSFNLVVPFEVGITGAAGNYAVDPRPLE